MIALFLACGGPPPSEIEALEARVRALRAEVGVLDKAVSKSKRVWRQREPIHIPKGFDATAALPEGGSTPDILLLSIDTLRADHLGAYGYSRDTSPFIDTLAASGTRYDQFWAPSPWTLPSHTTMLSGQLPDRHGVVDDTRSIGNTLPLVQQTLGDAGYATAGIVSTLFVSKKFGFDRGFDFFEDFGITSPKANNQGVVDAEEIFATALHWAQGQPDGTPLFLFLHSYDVHYTYNPPKPFDTQFDRPARVGDAVYKNYRHYHRSPLSPEQMAHQVAQYDEEIAYVDRQLERFISAWRASGREMVIAITSDHGEEFGERGSWGHAHTLYPEQTRVPLVIAGPGIRAQVVTERAGTEDLATTLTSLVGADHPPGDGRNRHRQLTRGGPSGTSGTYADTSRFDTNRVRWHENGLDLYVDLTSKRVELYDLRTDPDCRTELSTQRPEQVRALVQSLSQRFGTPWTVTAPATVAAKNGAIWRDGPVGRTLQAQSGQQFAIHPPDASIELRRDGAVVAGPFSPSTGSVPASDHGLTYGGRVDSTGGVDLSARDEEMLRELGYIQD